MSSHIMPATRRSLTIGPIVLLLLLSSLFLMTGTPRETAASAPATLAQNPSAQVWNTARPASNPAGPAQNSAASAKNPPISAQGIGTCFAPQPITGSGLFSFNNSNTVTGREGQTFAGCNFEGDPRIEHDGWYRWIAACTGPVTIQTCGLTSVDTKIAIYNGGTCPEVASITTKGTESLGAAGSLAGCSDDECGLQSSVTFHAVAGDQYLIQLGSAPNTAGGAGQFRITCDPPPKVSCCLPDQSCQNSTLAECRERGGFPGGTGSSCADNTVRPRPVDEQHENVVPLVWQPKHRNWNRDTNQNFVEDQIEQMALEARIDILIALNRVPRKQDLARFSLVGTLASVSRYIPVVNLRNIRVTDAIALGQDPHVAHVELEHPFFPTTDISIQAARVQGSGDTFDATCPGKDGTGVNIAIIDSGVDDGVHAGLSASSFKFGYDAADDLMTNPNDAPGADFSGHGTHVAGIALGRPVTVGSNLFRGMAPGAGLVDIQVFKPGSPNSGTWGALNRALTKVIAQRVAWNIGVVNLSLGDCQDSDGTDVISQLINNAANTGIVMVVSMGNSPNCMLPPGTRFVQAPAAADTSIAVQAASYENNVNRTLDAIATGFYLTGPRLSDNDLVTSDELKPDVTAHGTNSNSGGGGVNSAQFDTLMGYVRKPGTSMAAPHVAGLAALALQVNPTLSQRTTKELILDTAEHRGSTPGWQKDWGFGLIDGFAVCEALTKTLQTDIQFIANCNSADPLNWSSPDLFPGKPVIVEGVQNTINARIHNAGPNTAGPFEVELGFYDFSNSGPDKYVEVCKVSVPGMSVNQTITVSCPWIPKVDATSGDAHACLKAHIIHTADNNAANDCAQHNVDIKATMSPANFKFDVVNPTNEDLTIRLVHDLNVCASNGWTIHFSTPSFMLRAGDPPRTVEAILDPGAQKAGAQRVGVTVVGVRANGTELSLGGVTLVAQIPGFADCNHNGVADSIDIQLGSSKDQDHDDIPDECILCPSKTITINPATLVNQTWAANADYPPLNLTPTGGAAPYSFAVSGGATPPGMVVDPYGTLRGKPLLPGTYPFTVTVTDAEGCRAVREYRIIITNCPAITLNPAAGALPTTVTNTPYNQTFTATGGCSSSFTYSVTSGALPTGLTLSTNGALSGTTTQSGDFTFTVTATDSCGCSKSQTYTLKVDCPIVPLQLFNTGVANDHTVLPDGTADTHYGLTLPSGAASIARASAPLSLSWLPNTAASKWIVPSPSTTAAGFFTYRTTFVLTGCDPSSVVITGRWASDNDGFIRVNGGTAHLFPTPFVGFSAFVPFTLNSSNSAFVAGINTLEFVVRNQSSFTGVRVEMSGSVKCCGCPGPITLNPSAGPLPGAIINNLYSHTFTATGLCTSPFTYSVTSGVLPSGLTLSTNGVLSGTATQLGNSTFTVTASDGCGCSRSQAYTLIVENLRFGTSGIKISEFRLDGPNGAGDEFVELVNNTGTMQTIVSTIAGDVGWSVWGLVSSEPRQICTIPNGISLQPGQHFLCAKIPGYELGNYATPDDNINDHTALGLDVDGGVALFSATAVVIGPSGTWSGTGPVFREDAVGFRKKNSDLVPPGSAPAFREGDGLNPIGPQEPASRSSQNHSAVREYSFVRKHAIAANGAWSGPVYNDSNDNARDFALVSNIGDFNSFPAEMDTAAVQPAYAGFNFDPSPNGFPGSEAATTPVFGAPGPQNLASPLERNFNTQFLRSAFDQGSPIDVSPNRERSSQIVCGSSRGDLILRFTYKNNTGIAQSNLRVRWIDISTLTRNNPNFTSIIDLLDSTQATRRLFVNTGRDINTGPIAAQNDPPVAPVGGLGGNPANDGIVNVRLAGGAGQKVVRGTFVEGVDKTPPVFYNGGSFPPFGFVFQNFRQLNPTETDLAENPGTPCRVGGFNSATVATPPTPGPSPAINAGTTIPNLPATLPIGGSISLEHRFGVIKQGQLLIVGIIESN